MQKETLQQHLTQLSAPTNKPGNVDVQRRTASLQQGARLRGAKPCQRACAASMILALRLQRQS